jgi:S1-C subfamily serine protease
LGPDIGSGGAVVQGGAGGGDPSGPTMDDFSRDPQRPALGLRVGRDPQGRVLVSDVRPDSPVASAGLQVGDEVLAINQFPVHSPDDVVDAVRRNQIGSSVTIQVRRDGQVMAVRSQLGSYVALFGDSDFTRGADRPALGLRVRPSSEGALEVTEVTPHSPAADAGIRVGDEILAAGVAPVRSLADLTRALDQTNIGNPINLRLRRNGQEMTTQARVSSFAAAFGGARPPGGSERQVLRPPLKEGRTEPTPEGRAGRK